MYLRCIGAYFVVREGRHVWLQKSWSRYDVTSQSVSGLAYPGRRLRTKSVHTLVLPAVIAPPAIH